ncbi:MAG: IPT/TIG domain-containing protein, partial [bacterium]
MRTTASCHLFGILKPWTGVYLLLLVLAIPPILTMPAVAQATPGDTNADGIIDGRDALRIMRAVEGLDPPDPTTAERGDVHPFPGTDGRAVGDGVLTRADAERVLQYSVGLASQGELTSDYTGSAPRITDFEPTSGPIGTRVTIVGANFVPGTPTENVVFFGDTQTRVLEVTTTRIITEVPGGATTGAIRARTAGGSTIGQGEFVVTVEMEGVLDLDGGLNPADFILTSGYAETGNVQADGGFRLQLPQRRLTLVGAVPGREGNNSYLSVFLPNGLDDPAPSPLRVDARTTAAALVFMHPFFMTKNPATAAWLLELIEGLPEVEALAQIIAEKYPQGADGLNDPAVGEAWDRAVIALLNALPSSHVLPLDQSGGTGAKGIKAALESPSPVQRTSQPLAVSQNPVRPSSGKSPASTDSPSVQIFGIDKHYIAASYIEDQHSILPGLDEISEESLPWYVPNIGPLGYSPVDWVVTLYRIDPQSMPRGINESFLQLATRPLTETGYKLTTVVPANQWTARIDIVYASVDLAMNAIIEFFVPHGNGLGLQGLEDGVYMLRSYSGARYAPNPGDQVEFTAISNIEDGTYWSYYSTGINLAIAVVDVWDLCTGESKRWARAALKKGVQNGVRKLSQEYANADMSHLDTMDIAGILFRTLVDVGKGAATALPQAAVTRAQQGMLSQFEGMLSRANGLLAFLDKLSSVGRIGERLLGLLGYIVNPLDLEIAEGPSPLESILIIVGDPFSPRVHSIEPTEGGTDTVITITGERFADALADNQVYFQDGMNLIEGTVLSAQNNRTLQVRVPDDLDYNTSYSVVVETISSLSGSTAPQYFLFRRIPRLTQVIPLEGFAP